MFVLTTIFLVEMSKLTYSQVVTESSTRVIRGKGDRKLKSLCPEVRRQVLDQHKIKYTPEDNLEQVVDRPVDKIKQLPEGTIFTVGNLVLSPNQKLASKLGMMFKSRCSCCESCRFVGTAVWPGTYTRLGANKHLVKDIEIED